METTARAATGPLSPPVLDAPTIRGLVFRHFRDDEDFPAMLEVNNASKIADGLEEDLHSLESIRHVYSTTRNHDLRKDVLIAEVRNYGNDQGESKMVAFNRVLWDLKLDGTRRYLHVGFVRPEWRGKGLGRAMIRWAESRAREIEEGQTESATPCLQTEVQSGEQGLEELLKAEGYEPVRYGFRMETPDLEHIPDVPMPKGLEVRPVRPEHYRAIWRAHAEAFQDDRNASAADLDESEFESWIEHPFINQPDLWVVAWDTATNEVAGSILNYINDDYNARMGRKMGYTEWISVRRPWRRMGLARAMLARSMRLHKELGMTQTGLGVDTENPSGALQLYKSMGYQVVAQGTTYRKMI